MPQPLYHEVAYSHPFDIFQKFHTDYASILLDSALQTSDQARYSFVAIDPFEMMSIKNGVNPFDYLQQQLDLFQLEKISGLPPFQTGVAGYFGYELHQHLEAIPLAAADDMRFPNMILGFYDLVFASDHVSKKSYIFSSGFPEQDEAKRLKRAAQRLQFFLQQIKIRLVQKTQSTVFAKQDFKSTFTKETYCEATAKVIDYILCGDIFEANISQRFKAKLPNNFEAFDIYKKLRINNSASFAAYLNFHPFKIISASPERFIALNDRKVETRPIKGTRARTKCVVEDARRAAELMASEKDNAENVMIVDLMRNDLSRVCKPHSVKVTQLCGLESYATVHHLVSVIEAELADKYSAIDVLKTSFPGGSITGAPKIRSMEIIAEIEPTERGPYCGSIGYISFTGDMDTSITIRTLMTNENEIAFQVGGAVVLDSHPEDEYEETLAKGAALIDALTESA